MRTKLISGIGVALLLLAGCSGGDGGGDGDGDGPVEITFSHFSMTAPPLNNFLKVIEDFNNSQDDYRVSNVNIPFAKYHETILTQVGAGQGPTVVTINGGWLDKVVDAGLTENLKDKVTVPENASKVEQSLEVDGERNAVVFTRNPYILMANKKLLADNGLEVPTNYAEFKNAAEKLTDAPNAYGFAFRQTQEEADGWFIDTTNWIHGAGAYWTDGEKPTIDTPEMAEGIRRMKEFRDEGLVPKGTDAPTYRRLFWEGKIPMLIDALPFSSVFAEQSKELGDNLALVPFPFEDGSYTSATELLTVNNAASDKEKEAAHAFLNFVLKPESQQYMIDNMGGSLASADASFSEAATEQFPWLASWEGEDSGLTFYPGGVGVNFSQFRDAVLAQLERIFADKVSVGEGLAQAQKDAEAVLK